MKRSEINTVYREAMDCFKKCGWALPPHPRWDITDFGLGDFSRYGLTLLNLAEEPEYCEKLMYARVGQRTPAHTHAKKKEDITCRHGVLAITLWPGHPDKAGEKQFQAQVNGQMQPLQAGETIKLVAGERITLPPGIYHEFWAEAPETIIGEISTANDDAGDNFFVDSNIGRFPGIEEDEASQVSLLSE